MALTNLASMAFVVGDADLAWATAQRLANPPPTPDRSEIGQGWAALIEASVDADSPRHHRPPGPHQSRPARTGAWPPRGDHLDQPRVALQGRRGDAASDPPRRASGNVVARETIPPAPRWPRLGRRRRWALAHQGDLEAARDLHRLALAEASERQPSRGTCSNGAEVELLYGSAARASRPEG